MSAIAAAAGVVRQTVYNHFPDVDSIVGTAVERHSVESLRSLESVLAAIGSPTGKLDHIVRHSAVVAEHAPSVHTLYPSLSEQTRSVIEPHSVRFREIIEGILREGVVAGQFRQGLHPQRDAVLIHHLLDGLATLIIVEPGRVPEIVNTAIRTVRSIVSH